MSSRRRRLVLRHAVVVNVGCSCRRRKLPSFFFSSPKPDPPRSPRSATTTSLCETSLTATTSTTTTTTNVNSSSSPSRCGDCASSPSPPFSLADSSKGKKGRNCGAPTGVVARSTAVVKESSDPYLDFRDSMLQMIVEMEIYAWDDLRDLLRRFLALNAPRHHHLILRAFSDTWTAVFSAPSPPAAPAAAAAAGEAPPSHRT